MTRDGSETEFVERRHCSMHGEEHLRSCINAGNIDKMKADCDKTVENVYKCLAKKTPMWTFLPIAGILLSILAVQWKMFEAVADITKSIAVLEYKVSKDK